MIEKRQFYINGQWVSPAAARDFDVIDPATEEVCAVISLGDQADTDAAVAAAKAAFPSWAETPLEERVTLIRRLGEIYKERRDEMGEAIRMEMGAPIDLARNNQWGAGSWHLDGFLDALENFEFEKPYKGADRMRMEPIGVCGLITPWNWPMNQVVLKAIPAMAVGCTMVLKPSEISPLSSLLFAEMVDQAGFPAGVFNLVNGDGMGVGSQLSSHPDVDMISFTGSTRAGIAISKAAADTLKRVSLELGGKGANIIFADADEKAVKRGVIHCMQNSGQSCNAPTRMMVERSLYPQALEIAKAAAEATSVGPTTESGRHIGPVVSELQYNKIQGLIETGIKEGATLLAGGLGRPEGMNKGYFVRPTVFADVTPEMTIYREEIFGPVLSIMPFDSEEHAVEMANDTVYGLTNYIQTQDDDKRLRVARRVRSGMVETNGIGRQNGSPFGGYKQSGNGREGGVWGIEEFCEVKAISGCPME
ncbi:aldehyde dehydrogenase family protein [Shimia sp. CNT1-13L.2]|uniref:aldehyde dehydrogenase family protein n=1 Tax=Shimia sp. CNT1-13L.2 TaxID=2959663 RepID=UPI0020CC3790|nr:aldehyde dehydrogenase family protein [Shimia sp. CNT1-13L.2]MCP9480878.1 aldehyde dehydrogenase family protein [Shimia sp. CNT1-13L.2]